MAQHWRGKSRWSPQARPFRGRDPFEVAGLLFENLVKKGLSHEESLMRAGKAMALHGEPIPEKRGAWLIMQITTQQIDLSDIRVAYHGYLLLVALEHWWPGERMDFSRSWAGAVLARPLTSGNQPAWLKELIAEQGVKTVSECIATPAERGRLAYAKATLGSVLCDSTNADSRERGRILLEKQAPAMKRLLDAGDIEEPYDEGPRPRTAEILSALYGQVLNNLAQSWSDRIHGDIVDNLRRAIEIYHRVVALPTAMRAPPLRRWSLQHLAMCERKLALHLADEREVDERKVDELLRKALAHHEDARSLPCDCPTAPPGWLEGGELAYFNVRLDILERRLDSGIEEPREVSAEIASLTDEALRWVGSSLGALSIARMSIVSRFRSARSTARAVLGQSPSETDPLLEDALSIIDALHSQIAEASSQGRPEFLSREDARSLFHALISLPQEEPWSRRRWTVLSTVMRSVHPVHAGVNLAWMLLAFEAALLQEASQDEHEWLIEYIENAVLANHAQMSDVSLADAHRRCFAGSLSHLSQIVLTWAGSTLPPIDLARWFDLQGSGTFRADASFYGQGPTQEHQPGTEAGWRMNLYRAREELDRCSHIMMLETLGELAVAKEGLAEQLSHPMMQQAIESTVAMLRTTTEIGPGEQVRETTSIENPAEKLAEVRGEIRMMCQVGMRRGWAPANAPPVPTPSSEEIEEWLHENSGCSVLLVGGSLGATLVYKTETSCICRQPIISPELWGLDDLFREYFSALQKWISDTDDRRKLSSFDRSLDNLLRSPHTTSIADSLALQACTHGIDTLAILSRGDLRQLPWEAMMLSGGDLLGERVAHVHVATLASLPHRGISTHGRTVTYAAARPGEDESIDFGRTAMSAISERVEGPAGRIDFERLCISNGVVRLFAHAMNNPLIAARSRIILNERQQEKHPYNAYEISHLDLRGCRRVELWACESGYTDDRLGDFLEQDEPLGINSFFHLAGAGSVVGSWWRQAADSTALIAAGFSTRATMNHGAGADARALASAIQSYRAAVADEGAFQVAAESSICRSLAQRRKNIRSLAFCAGWEAAYKAITGHEATLGDSLGSRSGASPDSTYRRLRRMSEPEREAAIKALAREMSAELQKPWRWAGWRVTARSKAML